MPMMQSIYKFKGRQSIIDMLAGCSGLIGAKKTADRQQGPVRIYYELEKIQCSAFK